jgi:hypothetical protein
LLLALLAALGAGVAASFLWSQLQPTFHNGRTLRAIAGRPLLRVDSLLADRPHRKPAPRTCGSVGCLQGC